MLTALAALSMSLCTPFCDDLGDLDGRTGREYAIPDSGRTPTWEPNPGSDPDPAAANSPPVIVGAPPAQVMVGQYYRFAPRAVDPDGDRLSFSIRNKPDWAFFNTLTGVLSGVPQAGSAGTYAGIEIIVSDGKASTSTSAFPISVEQSAIGSITLSWQPPAQNEDGSALTDLSGYRIHLGQAPGFYDRVLVIDNPSVTTYVVENLVPGTYYIAATAVNERGVESRKSNIVVKVVG